MKKTVITVALSAFICLSLAACDYAGDTVSPTPAPATPARVATPAPRTGTTTPSTDTYRTTPRTGTTTPSTGTYNNNLPRTGTTPNTDTYRTTPRTGTTTPNTGTYNNNLPRTGMTPYSGTDNFYDGTFRGVTGDTTRNNTVTSAPRTVTGRTTTR